MKEEKIIGREIREGNYRNNIRNFFRISKTQRLQTRTKHKQWGNLISEKERVLDILRTIFGPTKVGDEWRIKYILEYRTYILN